MSELLVLAEHRRGELRDVTLELLSKGRVLAEENGLDLTVVLFGHGIDGYADELSGYADSVLVLDHPDYADFNAEAYQQALSWLIGERKPKLTLMGHTSFGVDLAPALAVELSTPLATDCIDLTLKEGRVMVTRQVYGGKLNLEASLREADGYIVTIRPATFEADEPRLKKGKLVKLEPPAVDVGYKRFVEYVEPPPGEVDIAEADILVSIGRGIKEEKNLPLIRELATALRGEVGCSRPIVDKDWLPKDRQVGSSGKTVKPKLYLAAGISGSFQHVMGMKGAGLIVAINRDPKAPIFRIADYGVVDDLFKIVPALTQKVQELKQPG
jgi:electron transfer flavoprotein alpha subunit